MLSYSFIGNWDEVNRELIEEKIDCAICYEVIFFHQGIENKQGALALQCSFC